MPVKPSRSSARPARGAQGPAAARDIAPHRRPRGRPPDGWATLQRHPAPRGRVARDRPGARGAPALPAPDRRGQPEDGRLHRRRAPAPSRTPGLRLFPLPENEGTPAPARRHHVGRRAADVRDRPRADEQAQAAAARRALGRPRPGRRAVDLRPHEAHPRRGLHGADRRAEHPAGTARRRSRLPARDRPHPDERNLRGAARQRRDPQGLPGGLMEFFDIFLVEAIVNGVLLGGLLALLALGLNLVFGVIDVIWICYAEIIMVSMYAIWWLHSVQGAPLWLAFPFGVAIAAALGAA